ncbi:hypothetical protein HYX19_04445 [Candidatus Woesearchaeota archaeon]|nr:hypothetical protein [Candidatus Woesearchaeota archaeon]
MYFNKKGDLTTLQFLLGLLLAIAALYILFNISSIVLTLLSTSDDDSFMQFAERVSKMKVDSVEEIHLYVSKGNIIITFDKGSDKSSSSSDDYNRPTRCLFERQEKRACLCKCKIGSKDSCFKGASCIILSEEVNTIRGKAVEENKFYVVGETKNIFKVKREASSIVIEPLLIK